jgi:hypothetical protein
MFEKQVLYFSNLVFVFNCFQITPFINTTLYLGNIGSLLGTLIMLSINPGFPYVTFQNISMSNAVFNFMLVVLHLIPVYIFRKRQTLRETFAPKTIAAIAVVFLAYFIFAEKKLQALYGMPSQFMGKMAVFIGLFFLGVHNAFY